VQQQVNRRAVGIEDKEPVAVFDVLLHDRDGLNAFAHARLAEYIQPGSALEIADGDECIGDRILANDDFRHDLFPTNVPDCSVRHSKRLSKRASG
jgi:hypothetical protein